MGKGAASLGSRLTLFLERGRGQKDVRGRRWLPFLLVDPDSSTPRPEPSLPARSQWQTPAGRGRPARTRREGPGSTSEEMSGDFRADSREFGPGRWSRLCTGAPGAGDQPRSRSSAPAPGSSWSAWEESVRCGRDSSVRGSVSVRTTRAAPAFRIQDGTRRRVRVVYPRGEDTRRPELAGLQGGGAGFAPEILQDRAIRPVGLLSPPVACPAGRLGASPRRTVRPGA